MREHLPFLGGFGRRSYRIVSLVSVLVWLNLRTIAASPSVPTDYLTIPIMESIGRSSFPQQRLKSRNLLIFAASRESAQQSRRWGNAIEPRYGTRIARWNEDHGQRVLVVPVLDTSYGMLSLMPRWSVKFLVKQLAGSEERDAVFIDSAGTIRRQFQPTPSSEALLILLGPNFKVRSYAIGEYSPANAAKLFAAIDFELGSPPVKCSDSEFSGYPCR